MRRNRHIFVFIGLLTLAVGFVVVLVSTVSVISKPAKDLKLGVTFAPSYAEYLELDWQETYLAVLEDLSPEKVRIPVQWSRVEQKRGEYDFSETDWMMERAMNYGADVTLVVGMKVPRWPECFIPEWARHHTREEYRRDILTLVETTVNRYKDHPALERWQVENEPFFPFGVCPDADAERFFDEIALVRRLDSKHPIQRTTSGEQSIWLTSVQKTDILGVSLYREVHNPVIGYMTFPIPPVYYSIQATLARLFVDQVVISELQAEPWLPDDAENRSLDRRYKLFTEGDLRRNYQYAKDTGIDEIFFWGVEWWYDLKKEGDDRLWSAGQEIFQSVRSYE